MRLAILADIHGNLPALEAVLADIETQAVDQIVVAGDAINAGVFPREVLEIIRQQQWPMVLGNHEEYILKFQETPEKFPLPQWGSVHWTAQQLNAADVDFLRRMPISLHLEDVLIVHGAPHSLTNGILPGTTDAEFCANYGNVTEQVIISGHTHLPIVTHWRGKILVNAGAVGIPLDGNPAACYALLSKAENRFIVQHRRVSYDTSLLWEAARQRGFLEFGGKVGELLVREAIEGKMYVIGFLKRLEPLMQGEGLSFAEATQRLAHEPDLPDNRYGLPDWHAQLHRP